MLCYQRKLKINWTHYFFSIRQPIVQLTSTSWLMIFRKYCEIQARIYICSTKKKQRKHANKNTKSRETWYNESCYALKEMCGFGLVCWYSTRQTPLDAVLFFQKKEYKKITRKLKRQFENAMLDRIENLSDKNPKEFWKLVNSIKLHQASTKTHEIQASEWYPV